MTRKRSAEDQASVRRAAYKKDLQKRIHKKVLLAKGEESWSSLAERADIARSTAGSATTKIAYSIENLVKIARATGRPLEFFVGEELPRERTNAEAVQVYREAVMSAVGALVENVSDEVALAAYREIERSMLRPQAPASDRARDVAERVVPGLPGRSGERGAAQHRAS